MVRKHIELVLLIKSASFHTLVQFLVMQYYFTSLNFFTVSRNGRVNYAFQNWCLYKFAKKCSWKTSHTFGNNEADMVLQIDLPLWKHRRVSWQSASRNCHLVEIFLTGTLRKALRILRNLYYPKTRVSSTLRPEEELHHMPSFDNNNVALLSLLTRFSKSSVKRQARCVFCK